MFGFELDRRLRAAGADIRSIVAHPRLGLDSASPRRDGINEPSLLTRVSARLLSPVAQGKNRSAWAAVRAAVDPDAVGGQYYGDLGTRRFIAAYRNGGHLVGIVAVNMPPKALRTWRAAIAARQAWSSAVGGTLDSELLASRMLERHALES
jgi:hypothetical protein